MSFCKVCKRLKNRVVSHDAAGCPYASAALCRRCHCRGHFAVDCEESWPHWERPTSLEELIPADLRARYHITTHTMLDFTAPRGAPGTERELSAQSELVIPDNYNDLGALIERYGIKVEKVTKESYPARLKAVIDWGVSHGYRVIEKSSAAAAPAPAALVESN